MYMLEERHKVLDKKFIVQMSKEIGPKIITLFQNLFGYKLLVIKLCQKNMQSLDQKYKKKNILAPDLGSVHC